MVLSVIFAFGELYCFAVIFGLRRVILRSAQFLKANIISLCGYTAKYNCAERHNIT